MSFVSDHSSLFEGAFRRLADTVSYNGADVAGVVCYAAANDNLPPLAGTADMAELDVLKSEVAEPARKDAVVIGGTTWTVQRTLSGSAIHWRLLITTNERPSRR